MSPGLVSWAQPGGFLEVDETVPPRAAVRETLEETGPAWWEPGAPRRDLLATWRRLSSPSCSRRASSAERRARRPRRSRSGRSPRTRSRGPRCGLQDVLLRAPRLGLEDAPPRGAPCRPPYRGSESFLDSGPLPDPEGWSPLDFDLNRPALGPSCYGSHPWQDQRPLSAPAPWTRVASRHRGGDPGPAPPHVGAGGRQRPVLARSGTWCCSAGRSRTRCT